MLTISKFFKQDIVNTNQTLKPVILITNPNTDEILFTLTLDKDELLDINGNSLTTINCISRVSNVKIANDYDSKRLKINRLRCTIYNYYDVKTKITEYINGAIISKNMYLFYKSPTTNVINITDDIGDYDCALVYRGEISRLDFNDDTLNISAEDRTQIKISNKTVPYMSIDKLSTEIQNNILPEYKEEDAVVPMTFGAVDKAPVMPYLDNNNDRIMNILLDVFPTSSHYKTARIPSLFHSGTVYNYQNDYYLYIKKSDDYIILDHSQYSVPYQNQLYSQIKLSSISSFNNNYILPELQPESENAIFKLWDMKGFYQRQVDSIYASDGSILDVPNLQLEDISGTEFENEEAIYNNKNYPKVWYRASDTLISQGNQFDTGTAYYSEDTTRGAGRWIILKLEEGIDNSLLNITINGDWAGNTFLACNYILSQSAISHQQPDTNNLTLPSGADRTGFFVAPIASEIWGDIMPDAQQTMTGQSGRQALANIIMCRNEAELETALNLNESQLQSLNTPTTNFYKNAPIFCLKEETDCKENKYWNISGDIAGENPEWKRINGLYYGDIGSPTNQVTESSAAHKTIAVFEYFPPYWKNNYSYQQQLKMDNIGLVHSVKVDNISEEKMFASIVGRKNNLFTEQLDEQAYLDSLEDLDTDVDIPLDYLINGPDGNLPDFDALLDSFYNTVSSTFNTILPYNDANGNRLYYYNKNVIDDFLYTENWETLLSGGFQQMLAIDDSPIFNNYSFFKNFIWKAFLLPCRLLQHMNALESAVKEGWDSDGYESFYQELQTNAPKQMLNFSQLFVIESWVKSIAKNMLEYIYQTDIYYDEEYNLTCWWVNNLGYTFDGWAIYDSRDTNIYMTDTIKNARQYNWASFGPMTTFDQWIDNFYVYMDDLFQAIHTGLCTEYQYRINRNEWVDGTGWPVWIDSYNANLEEFAESNSWILGLGALDQDNSDLESIKNDIKALALQNLNTDSNTEGFVTDGVIEKPCDIVMNILTNEMEYAKYDSSQLSGSNIIVPDYSEYDMDSLLLSREIHSNWKMGFSLNKKKDGKKLIEEILKESKSYPRFNSAGKFGFINIKDSYTRDDIDKVIDINNILRYRFKETKREDVMTSAKMFYRYDYGHKKYRMDLHKSINDYLPEYMATGYENYHLDIIDGHKDIKLKYHTDTPTVNMFMEHTLLNNCNTHNIVELTLPLSYMDLTVNDIIHIPLINNEKIFDIDYSVVDFKNSQPVYPLWLIMETNISSDSIKIKAYQLHYLGTDGNHGFYFEGEEPAIVGNMQEFNSTYVFTNGEPIPNWNYNPDATEDNGIEIPYFDMTGDGVIDWYDENEVYAGEYTDTELEKLKYNADGSLNSEISWETAMPEIEEIIEHNE